MSYDRQLTAVLRKEQHVDQMPKGVDVHHYVLGIVKPSRNAVHGWLLIGKSEELKTLPLPPSKEVGHFAVLGDVVLCSTYLVSEVTAKSNQLFWAEHAEVTPWKS